MSFFDFKANNILGNQINLNQFIGKKVLVVNVASACGLTPQYKQLQELYELYKNQNFEIIAFPANNFGAQEPGTNQQIKQFCETQFGVTFLMMAKISVAGDDIHPIYNWLTKKENNGVEDAPVTWNFQKFLINPDGSYFGMVPPTESPLCDTIINFVQS